MANQEVVAGQERKAARAGEGPRRNHQPEEAEEEAIVNKGGALPEVQAPPEDRLIKERLVQLAAVATRLVIGLGIQSAPSTEAIRHTLSSKKTVRTVKVSSLSKSLPIQFF